MAESVVVSLVGPAEDPGAGGPFIVRVSKDGPATECALSLSVTGTAFVNSGSEEIVVFDAEDYEKAIGFDTVAEPSAEDLTGTISINKVLGCVADSAANSVSLTIAAVEEPPVEPPVEPEEPTVPPEVKPPADKYPKQPPTTEVVHRVPEDFANVMAAIDAAKPGETVSVRDGFKCGELAIKKNFDPDKPVILRARNLGAAEFDKRVKLDGKGYWLHGFKVTFKSTNKDPDGGAILFTADYLTFTKLEVQSPHGISTTKTNPRGINIGWCWFNGQNPTGASVSNIYLHLPLGNETGRDPAKMPRNVHLYRNDFDDSAARQSGGPYEDHCIYFGPSKPRGDDLLCMEDVILYQNLIRESNQRVRGFYLKRGGQMVQNSLLSSGYNWGIRHGGDSLIEANIAPRFDRMIVNGAGTKIVGNACKRIVLYAGAEPDPLYQAADRAFLDSNIAPVLVGWIASNKQLSAAEGGKCSNVLVCNHSGEISFDSRGGDKTTFTRRDQPQGEYLPRLTLTPKDVGLERG